MKNLKKQVQKILKTNINIDLNLKQKEFENECNGTLIYLTYAGSHLFGLNGPNSDIDIKGLYLPSETDTRAFKPTYLDLSTNRGDKTGKANTSKDIDVELFSLETYLNMLEKGDTNAYDLLFSMFAKNTVIFETNYSKVLKRNYRDLLSSNSKAFLCFVLIQTKKYGIKGDRVNAIKNTISLLEDFLSMDNIDENTKVSDFIEFIKDNGQLPYVNVIDKGNKEVHRGGVYLEVNNKMYAETVRASYLLEILIERLKSYGKRANAASKGIDYKALSHALRGLVQFEELMKTHFIKFPLKQKEHILQVKRADLSNYNNSYEEILLEIENRINNVDNLIENSMLTDHINGMVRKRIELEILSTAPN